MTLHPYLRWRQKMVDISEYVDIEWALRSLRVGPDDLIVELGAGSGGLIDYLRRKGWNRILGVDLFNSSKDIVKMDLRHSNPPPADAYIFQHFLERIPQRRARELLKYCYDSAKKGVAGILPAHYVLDPTHVINHYTLKEVRELIDYVQPKFYVLAADMWSHVMPIDLDYLLIMSKKRIHRFRPRRFNWPYHLLSIVLLRMKGGSG